MIPIQVPPRVDLAEAHLAGKKLDNPCTTLITCIMLARQITLPQRQLLCFLLHPCKPSNFMQLRTLLRNGVLLSPLHSIISALFLSPRGWYPSASSALAGSVLLPVVGVNSGRPWRRSPAPASARSCNRSSSGPRPALQIRKCARTRAAAGSTRNIRRAFPAPENTICIRSTRS